MKNLSIVTADLKHTIKLFGGNQSEKMIDLKVIIALKEKRNTKKGDIKKMYNDHIKSLESNYNLKWA